MEKTTDRTKEIELRSDDIKELIGFMPEGLIRWANGAFLLVLLILLGIAWFVKYPDIVTLPVVLTTENPPIRSQNKANGKIEAIFVKDSATVVEGQRLALIESGAKYEDILILKNYVNRLEQTNYDELYRHKPIDNLLLGTIQNNYVRFLEAYNGFSLTYSQTIDKIKGKALNSEIEENKNMSASLAQQYHFLENDLQNAKLNLERSQQLFNDDVMSKKELEAEERNYSQAQRQLEAFKASFSTTNVRIKELETQIADIAQTKQLNIASKYETVKSALISLKNDLQLWEQNYFVVAPTKGIVSVPPTTQRYKTTTLGEELFTILPDQNTEKVVGLLDIPANLPGKISINASVNIKLDGYPYLRFGVLQGTLKSMTLVPVKNAYLARVQLTQPVLPLKTSSDSIVVFRQELHGTADIITEDKSILMRLFERFGTLVKR